MLSGCKLIITIMIN